MEQAAEFYKHFYPAQNERVSRDFGNSQALNNQSPSLLSPSWGAIFFIYVCELDHAITLGPTKVCFVVMENKQQIHGPPRATLVPVTQPTVVYKTVTFYFADMQTSEP